MAADKSLPETLFIRFEFVFYVCSCSLTIPVTAESSGPFYPRLFARTKVIFLLAPWVQPLPC